IYRLSRSLETSPAPAAPCFACGAAPRHFWVVAFSTANRYPLRRKMLRLPFRRVAMVTYAPPIAVDQLVKVYKTTTAVDGISFEIERGSITALLGGNGAGKTTTIATIMGLVSPTSGSVRVLGAEMPRQRHLVLHRMNFE